MSYHVYLLLQEKFEHANIFPIKKDDQCSITISSEWYLNFSNLILNLRGAHVVPILIISSHVILQVFAFAEVSTC